MDKEIWKDVPGYEGYYQASSIGRARSLDRTIPWREIFIRRRGKILSSGINSCGRLTVVLNKYGKRKTYPVHQLVLMAFVGTKPNNMECRHLDGDPLNNDLSNLRWGTASENQLDRRIHGTSNRGEKNCNNKLSIKDIACIKNKLRRPKVNMQAIADEYKVSRTTISTINSEKIWNWL